jgi:hypothetical protein
MLQFTVRSTDLDPQGIKAAELERMLDEERTAALESMLPDDRAAAIAKRIAIRAEFPGKSSQAKALGEELDKLSNDSTKEMFDAVQEKFHFKHAGNARTWSFWHYNSNKVGAYGACKGPASLAAMLPEEKAAAESKLCEQCKNRNKQEARQDSQCADAKTLQSDMHANPVNTNHDVQTPSNPDAETQCNRRWIHFGSGFSPPCRVSLPPLLRKKMKLPDLEHELLFSFVQLDVDLSCKPSHTKEDEEELLRLDLEKRYGTEVETAKKKLVEARMSAKNREFAKERESLDVT